MTRRTATRAACVVIAIMVAYLTFCGVYGHYIRNRELETEADRCVETVTRSIEETVEETAVEVQVVDLLRDPTDDLVWQYEKRHRKMPKIEPETASEEPQSSEPITYATTAKPPTNEAYSPPASDELTLLVYQVWGEIALADNTADYYGAKLQAAVVLNRIRSPEFPGTITEVIYQVSGGYRQFETWWYEKLMREGPHPNEACRQAVRDILANNDTPPGLIYADSRSGIPAGCYLFYESPTGQRFYCKN
jgi:hypothetical protein